jgi:hypothetical protein
MRSSIRAAMSETKGPEEQDEHEGRGHKGHGRGPRRLRTLTRVIHVLAVILLLLVTDFMAAPRTKAGTQTAWSDSRVERGFWQYNLETKPDLVKLVIRDKAGEVGAYKALFTVIAPDKQQYSSEKNGSGALESAVSFPNDFGAEWTKGVYTWTCIIGGRKIVHGSFEYCTSCQIRLLQTSFSPELYSGR